MSKKIHIVTEEEFEERCQELALIILSNPNIKNIYGIIRSGMYIAIRLSYMTGLPLTDKPDTNKTAIIESVQNTGKTRHTFSKFNNFFPLIDRQIEKNGKSWFTFYYELPLCKKIIAEQKCRAR